MAKLLAEFSVPAIVGMVVGSLYTVIDRAFLGNVVGSDAIAGVSIGMPIGFAMMAFGMLIGTGSGALVSIRLGEQRKDEAEIILGNALTLALVLAAVLTLALRLGLDPLLVVLGASPTVLPYARTFMHVIILGSVFPYVAFGLNAIIRAEGSPRLAMLTMFLNAGLNIVLDILFIWVFGWGVAGAAVATVIAQAASALWTVAHFRSKRSVLRLRWSAMRPRLPVLRSIAALGMAPCVMHLAGSVVILLLNRALARHGGDSAISSYGIISAVAMLFLMPVFGISQGAQPIIGFNHGARRIERVRRTFALSVLAATTILVLGYAVVQGAPEWLVRCFDKNPIIVATGARGLRICLAVAPVIGFQVIASNYFQAIGMAKTALVLTLSRQVLMLIPLILILPPILGLDGVWLAGPIADGLSTVLALIAVVRQLRAQPERKEPAAALVTEASGDQPA